MDRTELHFVSLGPARHVDAMNVSRKRKSGTSVDGYGTGTGSTMRVVHQCVVAVVGRLCALTLG